MHLPLGTIVNVVAVLAAAAIGLMVRRSLPGRFKEIVFQIIGLFTIMFGLHQTFSLTPEPQYMLALVFSLLTGGLIGEALKLEDRLTAAGEKLRKRVKSREQKFTEGLVTAFLIFCVGPLTIIGSIDDGLRGDPSALYIKSVLDFFMGIALTSTFGIGVGFSVIPLAIFQLAITFAGVAAQGAFSEIVIAQLTATGGVLIMGLGVNLLGLAKLRITNMLPSLLVIAVLVILLERYGWLSSLTP